MSKKHFLALDALRGIAALSVAVLHLNGYFPGYQLLPHAYLAVDFFFVLSGFVIAYAYESRLAHELTSGRFMVLRLKRLYPLIFAGVMVGLLYQLVRNHVEHGSWSAGYFAAATMAGFLLLPLYPVPPGGLAYPLNPPSWSLLCELVVNAVYALPRRRMSSGMLVLLIGISAMALCLLTYLGLWNRQHGDPALHWPLVLQALLNGMSRAGFSFFAGVALYRMHERPFFSHIGALNPLAGAVVLLALFAVPGSVPEIFNLLAVTLVFPVLVLASAQARPKGALARLSAASGWISYPLYALHFPVTFMVLGALKFVGLYKLLPSLFIRIGAGLCALLAAAAIGKFYDEPVRRWLGRKPAGNSA